MAAVVTKLEEALVEGVNTGKIEATYADEVLAPEVHEAMLTLGAGGGIVYSIPQVIARYLTGSA